KNLYRITEVDEIEEVNIGHSIIARAVFIGLERAVKELLEILM
ncbi:pyridoxine 5'-phosphate synthase, partial [candidate division WOR-3 bacterium]|nr:pyridoxine 5'-phosphate synthase [candidate division WOR-3 bacterium]